MADVRKTKVHQVVYTVPGRSKQQMLRKAVKIIKKKR